MIISISFGLVPVWARASSTIPNITVSASSRAALTDVSAFASSSCKQRVMPMGKRVRSTEQKSFRGGSKQMFFFDISPGGQAVAGPVPDLSRIRAFYNASSR